MKKVYRKLVPALGWKGNRKEIERKEKANRNEGKEGKEAGKEEQRKWKK